MIIQALAAGSADTVRIPAATGTPAFDGYADTMEYGAPSIVIPTARSRVMVWVRYTERHVILAARMEDSTLYWGDDLVISLDPDGSGGETPGAGDRQWYVRRAVDSSMVSGGAAGRWVPYAGMARLGARRAGAEWALRVSGDASSWALELRVDAELFRGRDGRPARLAVRTFDDRPEPGWYTWPRAPLALPPNMLELRPSLWVPVALGGE